jgi:hypothetical protein
MTQKAMRSPERGTRRSTNAAHLRRASVAATPPAASNRRQRRPGITLDCRAPESVEHRGIVFVHGIGSQAAGETLLDWGGAVIRALLDARVGHQASADPVIDVQLDPGPGESRFIELQLPEIEINRTPVAEQHWVMTEAWWAPRVRPPSFGQMAEWLGPSGAISRIVMALLPHAAPHDPRLRPSVRPYTLRRNASGRVEENAQHGAPEGMSARPSEGRRSLWRYPAAIYFQAVSALVLLVYGVLRSVEKLIPIGPLRDGALTRPIDRFVLEWFGDVYVLLSDPAQAASVRGRFVDAISDLIAVPCQDLTVVAHSGGAIVSYMALAGDVTEDLPVTRLVTLGEGLNLAWRLTVGEEDDPRYSARLARARTRNERLYRSLTATRPTLVWHDFWASKDPAPVGVLRLPAIPGRAATLDAADLGRVHSHAVWNRLSIGEDHGSYWENDEEFLVPLLRLLENRPAGTALFGNEQDDKKGSSHRRRRLSILSLWRQATMFAPLAAILASYSGGSAFLTRVSDALAVGWAGIPGSEALSDRVNDLRALDLLQTALGGRLAEIGLLVIGAGLLGATIYSVIAPPERPLPWLALPGWRRGVGLLLLFIQEIAAVVVAVLAYFATKQFLQGSTAATIDAAWVVLGGVVAAVALGLIWFLLRRPLGEAREAAGRRLLLIEGLEIGATVVAMALAAVPLIAPFVALALFEQTGRLVLGIAGVILLFQVLRRIGAWRWKVWDSRERIAARTRQEYPGVARVLVQSAFLVGALVALSIAVVLNLDAALVVGLVLAGLAVLLGVAVDVVDSARMEQQSPSDTLLRHARSVRGS